MKLAGDIGSFLLIAQESGGGGGEEDSGGSFLVSPELGLMIWTLLLFGATLLILWKLVFPRISEALDRRSKAIAESIDHAERTKREADELLEEYRARLREAREQAEDITARARKAADSLADQAKADASKQREELLASTRRDIEAETRRALDELRKEVANLTVIATEKITRKSLTPDDHRRLIEDALQEVDFSALSGQEGNGRDR
jgi:F-type H+-transporting ATPase subunit b